jgi:acid phosphatase
MKVNLASALFGAAVLAALPATAAPAHDKKRDVDTRYPYTGPEIPIGDWVDATVIGNGKGFIRLVEPPAVAPGEHSGLWLSNED